MYTIPFTEESVKEELCGKKLVYGFRKVNGNTVYAEEEFSLDDVPWRVKGGVLELVDERDSVKDRINAVEICNGQLFLSGDGSKAVDSARSLIYERKSLGDNFDIVISSHKAYEGDAAMRLVKSLKRYGWQKEITVVVSEGQEKEADYARLVLESNLSGSVGLCPIVNGKMEPEADYVLLLHDTMEAMPEFIETMSKVEVGLPFDFIGGYDEVGLWSVGFLKRLGEIPGFQMSSGSIAQLHSSMTSMCQLMRESMGVRPMRSKDVYGSGVKREVLELPEFGFKKYRGSRAAGGRP